MTAPRSRTRKSTTSSSPKSAAVEAKQTSPKNLRCDDELWAAYGELCKRQDTTISQALRKHMRDDLARDARASAASRRAG